MAQFEILLLMSGITGDLATPSVEGEVCVCVCGGGGGLL